MRSIDVGLLLTDKADFCLNGDFLFGTKRCCGDFVATALADGSVCWQCGCSERVVLKPTTTECSFTIRNVVIGIDFHWQRCEEQTFVGELHLFVEDGKVRVVNRVVVEDYLVSVISSEMSATSSLQLLKAHAIISRSWLYAQILRASMGGDAASVCGWSNDNEIVRWYEREDHKLFDFCADDHCQRYQGITKALSPDVKRAVAETADIVLEHCGSVCDARFSKCCGGITEKFSSCWGEKNVPYLASFRDAKVGSEPFDASTEEAAREWIESAHDAFCSVADAAVLSQVLNGYDRETNDFYRWRVSYTQSELSKLLKRKSGIDFGIVEELIPLERGSSGRITRLKIVGDKHCIVVGKELEIRRWLSSSHLYSSAFVVNKNISASGEPLFELKGAGWGHGVGLCQIGAAMMGEQGYDYTQILAHYYPDTNLKNINTLI